MKALRHWSNLFATIFFLPFVASALVETSDQGTWPTNWPTELEPFRKQARTHAVAETRVAGDDPGKADKTIFEETLFTVHGTSGEGAGFIVRIGGQRFFATSIHALCELNTTTLTSLSGRSIELFDSL